MIGGENQSLKIRSQIRLHHRGSAVFIFTKERFLLSLSPFIRSIRSSPDRVRKTRERLGRLGSVYQAIRSVLHCPLWVPGFDRWGRAGRQSQRARDAGGGLMIPVNGMCCGYHSMVPQSVLYALSTEGFLKMTFSPGMCRIGTCLWSHSVPDGGSSVREIVCFNFCFLKIKVIELNLFLKSGCDYRVIPTASTAISTFPL